MEIASICKENLEQSENLRKKSDFFDFLTEMGYTCTRGFYFL